MLNSEADKTRPVILAPAGTPESLKAAVANGADAVYLGVQDFNARMKAGNFTTETLSEWVSYAHLFGVKVYVTLNTLIKEKEFRRACETAVAVYKAGADGLILTDIGLARFCSENLPDIELYASTQLSIANVYGALTAKETGFTGVVCARECRLEDVKDVSSVLASEVFIQGAMCVCVSGQCYMSSMADGNSGNRGRCAQPCRKQYSAYYGGEPVKKGYLLSMKDLCATQTMQEFVQAGARTFKIEGRNRRPEYVAQASKTYRRLVDSGYVQDKKDLSDLKKMFNRGDYTKGYAFEENNPSLMSINVQGHIGTMAGQILAVYRVGSQIKVTLTQPFVRGDAFKIFDRTGKEIGSAVALGDSKGQKNGILFYKGKPTPGDFLAVTTDKTLLDRTKLEAFLDVKMNFSARLGEKASLTLFCKGRSFTVLSDNETEASENQPTDETSVRGQLERLGETLFRLESLSVDIEDGLFIPKSVLNNMRRTAVDGLIDEITSDFNEAVEVRREEAEKVPLPPKFSPKTEDHSQIPLTTKRLVCFSELSQLEGIYDEKRDTLVYKSYDFALSDAHKAVFDKFTDVYVDLPAMLRKNDVAVVEKWLSTYPVKGVVVNNLGGIGLAKKLGIGFIGGLGLNIANAKTVDYLGSLGADGVIFSMELNMNEITDTGVKGYVFAYGAVNNMTLTHCPYKTVFRYSDCKKCRYKAGKDNELTYVDELGNRFLIKRRRVADCYFSVINPYPLKYGDEHYVDFDYYIDLTGGAKEGFTRGRLFKGVK